MNKATYTVDVPGDRFGVLEIIAEHEKPLKLMLVGGVDSGKTTLLTFLVNSLVESGLDVAVVDSDVGQKGILPPATISLAFPSGKVSAVSELEPFAHYFIGTTSPAQYVGEMAVGVKKLADLASGQADIVVVDTTGFVTGVGIDMKRLKAELLRPDFTIVLERSGEMESLKRILSPYTRVLTLSVSDRARPHSPEERRLIRAAKWREYFSGAGTVDVDLKEVVPTGTELFHGSPLGVEAKELLESVFGWMVFAGWRGRHYIVVKADSGKLPRHFNRSALHAVDFEKLSNLLVGFIDESGLCRGLGILKWLNFHEMRAQVLTPLGDEDLSESVEMRFGRIRVLENGEELGLLRREEL
jgi:polynucleotide 5'-hydroxyl-kinase GRC3/NOL9